LRTIRPYSSSFYQRHLPRIIVAPSFLISLVFVYALTLWTGIISLTSSKLLPRYDFVGLKQYFRLFTIERWNNALVNMLVFVVLFISVTLLVGMVLAVCLDQKIRAEGLIKAIYLYPMALSFIVSGTAFRWIFNPNFGLTKVMQNLGLDISFDWPFDARYSLYAVVLVAVWQNAGFAMALLLAGLRGVDDNIIKAARMDGASPLQIYARIVLPSLKAVIMTVVVLLTQTGIKTFELVVGLTSGGPGFSSDLPATFMYDFTFIRNRLALGAASSMFLLACILIVLLPYLFSELKKKGTHHAA
jgi:glucose/mannose transport system permease protein